MMPIAKIFQPAKSAMQSGRAKSINWVLEFDSETPKIRDDLMGWCSSSDMLKQVRILFSSKAEAVSFAKKNKLSFRVLEPKIRRNKIQSYSDNFAFNRRQPWSH